MSNRTTWPRGSFGCCVLLFISIPKSIHHVRLTHESCFWQLEPICPFSCFEKLSTLSWRLSFAVNLIINLYFVCTRFKEGSWDRLSEGWSGMASCGMMSLFSYWRTTEEGKWRWKHSEWESPRSFTSSSSRGQSHYLRFSGQVKRADWKITYCTFSYVMQF